MNAVKLLLSTLATVSLFTPVALAQSYNARVSTPGGGAVHIRSLQTYEPIKLIFNGTRIDVAECGYDLPPGYPPGEFCRVIGHEDPEGYHYLEGLIFRGYIY